MAEKRGLFVVEHRERIDALVMAGMGAVGVVYIALLVRCSPKADKYTLTNSTILFLVMTMLLAIGICYGHGRFEDKLIRSNIYLRMIAGLYLSSFLNGCAFLLGSEQHFPNTVYLLYIGAVLCYVLTMSGYYNYEQTFFNLPDAQDRILTLVRLIMTWSYVGLRGAGTLAEICYPENETFLTGLTEGFLGPGLIFAMTALYAYLTFRQVKMRTIRWTLLSYNLSYLIAMPLERYFAGADRRWQYMWLYSFAGFVAIFLIFCNVYVNQSRLLLQQDRELTSSKLDAMIMQINPHFIYNTLGSIDSLIRTRPEEAHELLMKFSVYLRDNYSSLTKEPMVNFADELKILEHYLAIEQVRFPNLKVIYRIRAIDFKIPGLTVQPLAENAVKHGIRRRRRSEGTLTIESEETPEQYIVRIMDDGVGFEKIPDDGRPHIGISNARRRLEMLCGGTLNITSIPQTGTVCEILIPKEVSQEEEEQYYEGAVRG